MALNFPSNPSPGQVFTAEGVTFIWNGAVWLVTAPAGSWATPQEAIAGIRADVVMSPATVQARQGRQTVNAAGLTQLNFDEVPDGIEEMDLLFNNLIVPATAQFRFGFAGAPAAAYGTTRHLAGASYTPPINGATNEYTLDEVGASNSSYMGVVRLSRGGSGFFNAEGSYRRGNTELIKTAGRIILNLTNSTDRHFIQLRSSIAFVSGAAVVRWRF